MVGLVEAHSLSCVDREVASVNVVTFHDHFENFRLVDSAFFHKADDLVLHHHSVINIVVKLNCDLVLELTILAQEVFFVDRVSKVLLVLSQKVDLAIGSPRVEPIAHGVLRPNAHVLASS